MSWEIDSIDEIECPCGQGKIIRENKSDDWNRYDENVYLQCETCKKRYHIETRHFGHGIESSTSYYLVKNGETIQDPYPNISKFENRILVDFYLEDLQIAIREMQNKKYSTEINDMNARQIISIHKKYCKSVKLQPIIQKVNRIISIYENAEWNRDKYEKEKERRSQVERIHIVFK